jgi:hypothetical protein
MIGTGEFGPLVRLAPSHLLTAAQVQLEVRLPFWTEEWHARKLRNENGA